MVRLLIVPVLHDVYLAIAGPVERLGRQHPICRPYAWGARWERGGFDVAARARKRLV